jgi:hypothetical protein
MVDVLQLQSARKRFVIYDIRRSKFSELCLVHGFQGGLHLSLSVWMQHSQTFPVVLDALNFCDVFLILNMHAIPLSVHFVDGFEVSHAWTLDAV